MINKSVVSSTSRQFEVTTEEESRTLTCPHEVGRVGKEAKSRIRRLADRDGSGVRF